MLTKSDLINIKRIVKEIVREEIEAEGENIKTELGSDITQLKIRMASEFKEVNNRLKNLEIKSNKIQKDLKTTINFFDKEVLGLKKRVDEIEEHLQLQ